MCTTITKRVVASTLEYCFYSISDLMNWIWCLEDRQKKEERETLIEKYGQAEEFIKLYIDLAENKLKEYDKLFKLLKLETDDDYLIKARKYVYEMRKDVNAIKDKGKRMDNAAMVYFLEEAIEEYLALKYDNIPNYKEELNLIEQKINEGLMIQI